jgi:hypothetical protein
MVNSGQATVATPGTAVQVSTDEAERSYMLRAHPGNTGNVAIGNANVTVNNGLLLASGDSPIPFFGSLADLYVDAENAGDKLCWASVL